MWGIIACECVCRWAILACVCGWGFLACVSIHLVAGNGDALAGDFLKPVSVEVSESQVSWNVLPQQAQSSEHVEHWCVSSKVQFVSQ